MNRRHSLIAAALLASVAGVGALGVWRARHVRAEAHHVVVQRLAGTATLTRDAARHWAQELSRDLRIAIEDDDVDAALALPGYAALWRVTRADLAAGRRAGRLVAAERAAADSTLADGRQRFAGPFAAATASGVAISAAAPVPGRDAALVLRSDPGPTLLALAARRVAGNTENGCLLVRVGDSVRVVAPSDPVAPVPRFTLITYPLTRFTPAVQRLLRAGTDDGLAHTLDRPVGGREMLAVVARVPGTEWSVVRQVAVAEVDAPVRRQLAAELLVVLAVASTAGLGVLGAARAERARRRQELASSEARLAATLRASIDAVVAVDEHECVVFCNAAAERLLGAAPGTLVGRRVGALAAPEARDRLLDGFRRFAAGERMALTVPASADVVLAADDGRPMPCLEVALSKGEAEGGRLVMCILRDVSEREDAAAALRASEASARAFVEHSPYGICRVAPDGRFTVVNPALVSMLGYASTAELCATDLGELYVDPAARADVLRRHAAGEEVVDGVETLWRRRDESTVPVRVHSREVRDAAGTVAYYEAYLTDLAALRGAEQALRQAEKLAAVGRFVSGVAHELNNPLAAILLVTDGLLDDLDRPGVDHEALTLVREQALRARAIVRDLLTFVRGAGGPTETVDARTVLHAAVRALAPQAAAAGSRLDLALGPDLGWLRVDPAGVEQVVANLVVNALHAAPTGTVRLAAERDGPVLRITVDDQGPGIAPDVAARMFEPFYTTKPVGVGTGLGLSVSLGTVERYGGTLVGGTRAPDEAPGLGPGARFTVTLPVVPTSPLALAGGSPLPGPLDPAPVDATPVDAAPIAAVPAEPRPADVDAARPDASVTDVRAPRLLVVDDEESIRQALARFFGRRGWAVDEAGDGRAAFARLLDAEASGAPYDLVLSDVRMPDVSGVALHDWIARTRPTLLERVVFATGDDASAESADFIRRTRCRVLAKPFDADTLAALARDAGTAVPRDDGGHVDDDAALAAASAAPAIVTMPANARADRPPAHGPA